MDSTHSPLTVKVLTDKYDLLARPSSQEASCTQIHTGMHGNNLRPNPWTTQVTCSWMWPPTCDQHFSCSPTDGLSKERRKRCEMWRILSVMRTSNRRTRLCIRAERLIHRACSVDTVQQQSHYLSAYFATTDSDLKIYE